MSCPVCGRESFSGATFCTYCGSRLGTLASFESRGVDAETKSLGNAVSAMRKSDRMIAPWLVILPLVINVVVFAVVFAAVLNEILSYDLGAGEMPSEEEIYGNLGWVTVFTLIGNLLFYGVFAALTYILVDRNNKHLRSETLVRQEVTGLLAKADSSARRGETLPSLRMYDTPPGATASGTERSPLFWALVVFLPVVGTVLGSYASFTGDASAYYETSPLSILVTLVQGVLVLYLLHLLNEDTWKHDQAWTEFATGTRISLARLGLTAGGLHVGMPLPRRSSGLYILVSVLTLGLFMFYWWYVIVKDPNTHYEKQAMFESQLVQLLSPRA